MHTHTLTEVMQWAESRDMGDQIRKEQKAAASAVS